MLETSGSALDGVRIVLVEMGNVLERVCASGDYY